jgi:TonB family protein
MSRKVLRLQRSDYVLICRPLGQLKVFMKAIIRAITTLAVLCVVTASHAAAQQAESAVPRMPQPRQRDGHQPPPYPSAQLKAGKPGTVLVEFSIDTKGSMKRIKIKTKDSVAFQNAVKKEIKDLTFDVPADWAEKGGEAARYVITYLFEIDRTGRNCSGSSAERDKGNTVMICASLR